MWIEFSFVCSFVNSRYAVRHYVICRAGKELRAVFGNVFFRAFEMWPKALLDALSSFGVLVLETDQWRRIHQPAVNTGYSSCGQLAGKFCKGFDDYFIFVG
jgi:hypothetical protein